MDPFVGPPIMAYVETCVVVASVMLLMQSRWLERHVVLLLIGVERDSIWYQSPECCSRSCRENMVKNSLICKINKFDIQNFKLNKTMEDLYLHLKALKLLELLEKLVNTLSYVSTSASVPSIKRILGFARGCITKNVVKGANNKNKNSEQQLNQF